MPLWDTGFPWAAGPQGKSFLMFWGTSILLAVLAMLIYTPSRVRAAFLHICGVILAVSCFDNIHLHRYEVTAHCGANFHFSHGYHLLRLSLYATNATWPCIANGWVKFPSLWSNREGCTLESGWKILQLVYWRYNFVPTRLVLTCSFI